MFFNTVALQITLITEQFQNSGHIALGYAIAKCKKFVNIFIFVTFARGLLMSLLARDALLMKIDLRRML